jgi:uncharacterized NAD(P)/FAD-binding protein YdhS
LNVPAAGMSAFADRPGDFVDWLCEGGYGFSGSDFVPRRLYRLYVFSVLHRALAFKKAGVRYRFLQDGAVDVFGGRPGSLQLASGRSIEFDSLVLAVGNFEASVGWPERREYLGHPAYYASAWDRDLFGGLAPDARVLLLGTGLSMVDMVLTLAGRGHRGAVFALSRHGLLPGEHEMERCQTIVTPTVQGAGTALDLLGMVNRQLKVARREKGSWQAVVDGLRPFIQKLWQQLSTTEKKKFMEHIRHRWNVARHRIPAASAGVIREWLDSGRLRVLAGQVQAIHRGNVAQDQGFRVVYRERGSGAGLTVEVDCIVNCMGPETNFEKIDDVLIRNLLRKGMIRPDALKLGLDCTPEGVLVERSGLPSSFLYTLGPPAKPVFWEMTSVPEIRVAARQLAALLGKAPTAILKPIHLGGL